MKNFQDILESRRFSKDKSIGDAWNFDEETAEVHSDFFYSLLGGKSLNDLGNELRHAKGSLRVLNVLGGLKVVRDLQANSGTSIRLKDHRSEAAIKQDADHNLKVVTGDILARSTWRNVPAENDLILELGQGALYSLPVDNIDVYSFLVNEMWQKLALKGTLLAQAPSFAFNQLSSWIDILNSRNNGIQGSYFAQDKTGMYCGFSLKKNLREASLTS